MVILTQLQQLLAFVNLDAVQHSINLLPFRFRFVICPVAKRAAVHANQLNDPEANKYFSNDLQQQSQKQESDGTDSAGYQAVSLDMEEEYRVDK